MPARVARDKALIGLKVRFPHSFNQISARMSASTGAWSPPRIKHSDTRLTRSLVEPSGSPTGKRLPSMCLMTPCEISSVAGYTTQPITRSQGMFLAINPVGSTLLTCVPASAPPCA